MTNLLSPQSFLRTAMGNEWVPHFLKDGSSKVLIALKFLRLAPWEGHLPALERGQPCVTFLSSERFRNTFLSKDGDYLLFR